ncbi:MAG: EcsC family protein [Desulfobacterales bacterium]|nr:EcsC family protein [Desulfobacterales bacterium]
MKKYNEYEQEQIEAIKAWKSEEVDIINKSFGLVTSPAMWLMERFIPMTAIMRAINKANTAAEWLTDSNDILRESNVAEIHELKKANLKLCDTLANKIHNWAIGIAAVEGGLTGSAGIFGFIADIPAIITLALRTIHKIGLCYGFQSNRNIENQFILSILSAAGANSADERANALIILKSIELTIAKQAWKEIAEKAFQQQLSKEGALISIKSLAKQLGINLTERKALQTIPAFGALIGGPINAWYIKDVGWAARRAFQERWLIDNYQFHPNLF